MPVFELGYRPWEGRLRGRMWRWWVFTRSGVKLAFRSVMLRRCLFLPWVPMFTFALVFFAFGYITDPKTAEGDEEWINILNIMLGSDIATRVGAHPEFARPFLWATVFHYFLTYSQSWLTMIIMTIIGPPLISEDLKNKSYLLYFSKPIGSFDYIMGKVSVLLSFTALITLLPGLALYALSIILSPSIMTLQDTWMIPLELTLSWFVISIPLALLMLALSSLTHEHRYASFSWVGMWIMGETAFLVLRASSKFQKSEWTFLFSIRQTLVVVSQHIFDAAGKLDMFIENTASGLTLYAVKQSKNYVKLHEILEPDYPAHLALIYISILSVGCIALLRHRVIAPMRI